MAAEARRSRTAVYRRQFGAMVGDASLSNKPKACFLSAAGALILLAAWSASTWHHIDEDPPFSIAPGAFGSCPSEVQQSLRWGSDRSTGNRICCHNSRYAERAGYWLTTSFLKAQREPTRASAEVTFYDSVTGLPLFVAPRGRSWQDFVAESRAHGWPSFRDVEVVWSNVRVVSGGETVSVNGTHLGHNLPDGSGNRYCINIVCVAGSAGLAIP